MTRIACFFPFGSGPEFAGLHLELLPLQAGFLRAGHTLDIYTIRDGRYALHSSTERPIEVSKPVHGSRDGLPADLHWPIARFLYEVEGTIVPPFLRFSDLSLALSVRSSALLGYDGFISFKPWFRSVYPALQLSREFKVPAVLLLDDYDVTPRARFPHSFVSVFTNSVELSRVYSKWSPITVEHTLETWVRSTRPSAETTLKTPGSVLLMLPSTGVSDLDMGGIVGALTSLVEVKRLIVVGANKSFQSSLKRWPREVTFVNRVPRVEVLHMIDSSSVVVVPQPDNIYGSMKRSGRLLECLARGTPVAVPARGESERIVEEAGCGFTYDPSHPRSLLPGIKELLSSDSLRVAQGRRGWDYTLAAPSWDDHATRILKSFLI